MAEKSSWIAVGIFSRKKTLEQQMEIDGSPPQLVCKILNWSLVEVGIAFLETLLETTTCTRCVLKELLLILRRLAEHFAAAACTLASNKGTQPKGGVG